MRDAIIQRLPTRLGLVPGVEVVHWTDDLDGRSDKADLAAQVVDGLVEPAHFCRVGDRLTKVVQEGNYLGQRHAVPFEVVIVDDAPTSHASLKFRLVEAMENAVQEDLGGATALRSGFLGIFEEDAELQTRAKVPERVESLGCLVGVQEFGFDVVRSFYGPRQQFDAVNRLNEEIAYFPTLMM